jgi:hypothetical protein
MVKLFDRIKKENQPNETNPAPKQESETEARTKSSGKDLEAIDAEYPMPDPRDYNYYTLDPLSKRKMTICNLFANHGKSIVEIIELLGCSRKLVVDTLVENKLVKDRRKLNRPKTPCPEELGKKRI